MALSVVDAALPTAGRTTRTASAPSAAATMSLRIGKNPLLRMDASQYAAAGAWVQRVRAATAATVAALMSTVSRGSSA